ncbi:hypothetical protein FACS1894188_07620 [Clostridia bacterium]|nr:hypothetical protein FACS1894188_07620 [Clostridia bacterium]
MNKTVFDVWENKHQNDYRGEFDDDGLIKYLEDLRIETEDIAAFMAELSDAEPSDVAHTLYLRSDWTIDVVKTNKSMTYSEFMRRVYEEYSVYSPWFDELFRNVLDESADLDPEDVFEFLDRMLPDELPRQWIRRLEIQGELKMYRHF